MKREPDWEALSDLQFLLYNRIADSLNAALSAIALSDMPEAQDKPPGYWKNRATAKIANVLNLFMAWSYLIRYKMGESIPERSIRPFHVNALLVWLAEQLQISPTPQILTNPLLHANQETLQEALLLLYSAAFSQGTNVRLEMETTDLGLWFRVKFTRTNPLPQTLDDLLKSFGDHWRAQDTVFELTTARDFVRLNGSELILSTVDNIGELAFFVVRVAKSKTKPVDAGAKSIKVQAKETSATPVIAESSITPERVIETPSLAILRPLPPRRPSRPPVLPNADGQIAPVEPAETKRPSIQVNGVSTAMTPVLPPEPDTLPSPDSAGDSDAQPPHIIGLKIPPPVPPASLRTPPASTSNVALTRDTQTTRVIPAESVEKFTSEASAGESEEKT